jgi:O-antigen ligase
LTSLGIHPVDFDPSYVTARTYASRRRRYLVDIAALINIMVLTLFLLPEQLVFPQLTAVGRPALMVGLALTGMWLVSKLHPRLAMPGPQPMRWAAIAYFCAFLMSYAAGYFRGLTQLEANATDRAVIGTAIFLGTILACADGLPNRRRLDDVVHMLVWCAGIMAFIGLMQFALTIDITEFIQIPGLKLQTDLTGLEGRAGYDRVASTTGHYIEFSTVMVMCLPFAIHIARFGRSPAARQAGIVCGLLCTAAIPATLSRTGFLALAVMAVVMVPIWPWRTRFNVVVCSVILTSATMLVRPGLLGTIKGLFANADDDPSIAGRTEDYAVVYQYIAERPWLGRGPGTFIPKLYIILDNQWLSQLVSAGVIGVAALAAVHITAITLAAIALRRSAEAADRHLCVCLIAVQLVAIVVGGTFDSFGFSTFVATLALLTGLAGTMWRLTHPARQIRTTGARLGRR